MNIELCYVNGINRIDTPYFSSLSEQSTWFSNKVVCSIETTFYPPHYQNKIRCSIDDIDFTDSCNYLYFTFRNKTYYYFIDDITYINENLIELDITMDYIQTYMFNINVNNGIIERKCINRWVRFAVPGHSPIWSINRGYIRENVGNNDFIYNNGNVITPDYWVVIKFSKINTYWHEEFNMSSVVNVKSNEITSPFAYCFIPLNPNIDTIILNNVSYSKLEVYGGISQIIKQWSLSPNCIDMYVVPYNPIPNYASISGTVLTLNPDYEFIEDTYESSQKNYIRSYLEIIPCEYLVVDNQRIGVSSEQNIEFQIKDIEINFDFQRNTDKNVLFQSIYEPCLLDDNYTRLIFGSNNASISIPLYEQVKNTTTCYYGIDFSTGARIYGSIPTKNTVISFDYWSNYTIDNNILGLEMGNNAWNDYVANNRNRWVSAGFSTLSNIAEQFISIATNNYGLYSEISSMLANPRSYTKKKKLLKAGIGRSIESKRTEEELNILKGFGNTGTFAPLINQYLEEDNIKHIPNTLKQSGGAIAPILSYSTEIYYCIQQVTNYEQSAKYFQRNGYLVNDYINNVNNLFSYIQNRYYFNVLKMAKCELVLTDAISDSETIENIKDRLFDGLRLWNISNQEVVMGDFTSDNVELSFIEQ